MIDLVVLDPVAGDELFRDPVGERRIPWSALVEVDNAALATFQRSVTEYIQKHPRIEVEILDSAGTDEMVVRWMWRR